MLLGVDCNPDGIVTIIHTADCTQTRKGPFCSE